MGVVTSNGCGHAPVMGQTGVSLHECTHACTCRMSLRFLSSCIAQDLAKYINEVKRDYETIKAIKELERSITDYRVNSIFFVFL